MNATSLPAFRFKVLAIKRKVGVTRKLYFLFDSGAGDIGSSRLMTIR